MREKQEKAIKASASCHHFRISGKISGDERKRGGGGKENYFLNIREGKRRKKREGRM